MERPLSICITESQRKQLIIVFSSSLAITSIWEPQFSFTQQQLLISVKPQSSDCLSPCVRKSSNAGENRKSLGQCCTDYSLALLHEGNVQESGSILICSESCCQALAQLGSSNSCYIQAWRAGGQMLVGDFTECISHNFWSRQAHFCHPQGIAWYPSESLSLALGQHAATCELDRRRKTAAPGLRVFGSHDRSPI